MQTISFYSFKGGVGRSALALNVAYELARAGKFVVLADWDIHAPGLSTIESMAMPEGPHPRKGILEFLASALDTAGEEGVEVIDPQNLAQPTILSKEARSRNQNFFGDLYFIPAGKFEHEGEHYHEVLRALHMKDLATWRAILPGSSTPQSVLSFFRERVENIRSDFLGKDRSPDYLLLDSRTGLTEIGDLLLGDLVDHYVVVFGLNEQNLLGMELILREGQLQVAAGRLPQFFTLVVSPVPTGEEDLLRHRLGRIDERLERMARPVGSANKFEPMPKRLSIPYHPRLALAEEIMIERYPQSGPALAYVSVAEHLQRIGLSHQQVLAEVRSEVLAVVPPQHERPEPETTSLTTHIHSLILPTRTATTRTSITQEENPYDALPSWNWAAPELSLEQISPGEHHELRRQVADALAWSAAVVKDDKERILSLSDAQLGPPLQALLKERDNLRRDWGQSWRELEKLLAQSAIEWVEILANRELVVPSNVWRELPKLLPKELSQNKRFLLFLASGLKHSAEVSPIFIQVCNLWPSGNPYHNLVSSIKDKIQKSIDDSDRPALKAIVSFAEGEALRVATELNFDSLDTLKQAGWSAIRAKWYEIAEQISTDALEIYPEDADLLCIKASALWSLSKLDEAEKFFQRASNISPTNAFIWLQYGILLSNKPERLADAETAIREGLRLDPRNAEGYCHLARVLSKFHRYSEAEREALKATRLAPNSASCWLWLAILYGEKLQRHDDAKDAMAHVIKTAPKNPSSYLNDADLALHGRDLERAFKRLEQVSNLPNNESILRVRDTFYIVYYLLQNNKTQANVFAKQLVSCAGMSLSHPTWDFNPLINSLTELDPPDVELVKAAANFAKNNIKVEVFASALAQWSRSHLYRCSCL